MRRKILENDQLALLEAKKRRGEEVRAKKISEEGRTRINKERMEEE